MKKGFTLVELSIVLVIIGLLIGGILVAQSMVTTSKILAVASQIQQFDAGVMNFKTKYNSLPGDALAFGGNGDGVISCNTPGCPLDYDVSQFQCEIEAFWNNLFPEQYPTAVICDGFSGAGIVFDGSAKNVPMSKLDENNAFFVATSLANSFTNVEATNPNIDENYYIMLRKTQIFNPYFKSCSAGECAAKSKDLLSLDKKIDDGIENTGNVISGRIKVITANTGAGDKIANCNYNSISTTNDCVPMIRIGGAAGDPQ